MRHRAITRSTRPNLQATTPDTAAAFYKATFGWTTDDANTAEPEPYRFFQLEAQGVAGLYQLPEAWGEGHRSCWTPCIRCDEIDAVTARAAEYGCAHLRAANRCGNMCSI
jgi:predicted enzyme related to lactoylglutathione lyase